MEKPWLAHYPSGIPAEINIHEFASVAEVVERSCARYSGQPAYTNLGATLSFAKLDRLSLAFAAFLRSELGLEKGERVALMMPNLLQYPVAIFGVLHAGCVVVNTNPQYTARELKYQLTDSGATAIVVLENFAHVLAEVVSDTPVKHVIVTGVGDLLPFPKSIITNFVIRYVKKLVPPYSIPGAVRYKKALRRGRRRHFQRPELGHDDLAFLQYTGGTTGAARGAMLSHGNIVANLQQVSAWLGTHLEEGREVIVTALPLYHIFALMANCLVFLKLGGLNHLITNPRDLPGFVRELKKSRFTAFTSVNTLFNGLLNTTGFSELDFSTLKLTLGGGMAVHPVVAERWKKVTGLTLIEGYGLTETSPVACANRLDLEEYNGSIGLPLPSTDCSVQDDEGNLLSPGEKGELCVRGPQVMKGYWDRPDETAEVLSPDGWLRTGDIATMDESGYFRIVDRKKDMILVGGFNVYPGEVEAVATSHPDVLEAAAVGTPDRKFGEVVKLFVVKKNPDLSARELRNYCEQNLAYYKVPRRIEFRDTLPKTNVGKILRRELRETEK